MKSFLQEAHQAADAHNTDFDANCNPVKKDTQAADVRQNTIIPSSGSQLISQSIL